MKDVKMKWLDTRVKGGEVSFGVPHERGALNRDEGIKIMQNGSEVTAQTHPIAFWNDGSVKWTSVSAVLDGSEVTVSSGESKAEPMLTEETESEIKVDNGVFTAVFAKNGKTLMETPDVKVGIRAVKSVIKYDGDDTVKRNVPYYGEADECYIEETGAVKTTVCIKGTHRSADGSEFLRFIVRFIIFKGSSKIDIKHTFIYDGDASVDFIGGIAVDVTRKMSGSCMNRRVKITGDYGVLHEPLQILNVWRPRIGNKYYDAQMRGENVDVSDAIDARNGQPCAEMLDNVTIWDSYRLYQATPDSFLVKKRTAPEVCAYIDANFGRRSKGLMYAGDEKGGFAVAMRNFYEKAPSEFSARGLSQDEGTITAWIHPTEAEPLDMRHYDTIAHDQTYYEGYPWVGSDPYGIATTNEISVMVYNEVPSDEMLMEQAETVQKPPVLICEPEYYKETNVMGVFSLPERTTPLKTWLEDELDKAVAFYMKEVEQRHWYGLFNYGDIMHTYDYGRHCWKYDMGGYAWQNTELVPTLWLWYAFLRSGRGDIFDMAEAMSRHAADVDVYHIGDKKGIGSRHNVIHWGDSCKEPRIAMAGHHRALYYIMGGDYRIGDVFDDVRDGDFATLKNDPLGAFYDKESMKLPTHARSGPDWSTYCSNWYTEWERHENTAYRDKIMTGINDLKKAPMKMVSGSNFEYDPATGHLGYIGESAAGGAHLAVCMGGPETWMELANLLGDDEFKDMLIKYGEFYFLSKEEKVRISNGLLTGNGFAYPYMASALVGYAAKETDNKKLGYQVWQVLIHSLAGKDKNEGFDKEVIKGYFNNDELDEMFWISTNFTAQWCLNTIVALELTKDYILDTKEEYEWEDWVK